MIFPLSVIDITAADHDRIGGGEPFAFARLHEFAGEPLHFGDERAVGVGGKSLGRGDRRRIGRKLRLDHRHAVGRVGQPVEEGVLHDGDDQFAHADEEVRVLPPFFPQDQVVRPPEPGIPGIAVLHHIAFDLPHHDAEISPVPVVRHADGTGVGVLLVGELEGFLVLQHDALEHAGHRLRLEPDDVPLIPRPRFAVLQLHEIVIDHERNRSFGPSVRHIIRPGDEVGAFEPGRDRPPVRCACRGRNR